MNFKTGDRVSCIISGYEIKNAQLCSRKDGYWYISQNILSGVNKHIMPGYEYSWATRDLKHYRVIKKSGAREF